MTGSNPRHDPSLINGNYITVGQICPQICHLIESVIPERELGVGKGVPPLNRQNEPILDFNPEDYSMNNNNLSISFQMAFYPKTHLKWLSSIYKKAEETNPPPFCELNTHYLFVSP